MSAEVLKTFESKIRKALEGSKLKGKGSFVLALIIITAAFILIGAMLSMEHSLTISALDQMSENPQIFTNTTHTQNFKDAIEKIQQSNISVFNILLPVFGAWVGAVVAFHFGAENLKTAQATISKLAGKGEEILARITVKELLDEYPGAENVISAAIDDTMKNINEKLNSEAIKGGPLLILDKQQKPLGMLYGRDFFQPTDRAERESETKFSDFITKREVKDFIKGTNWTVKGVNNFAKLKRTDSLLLAQSRMYAIDEHSAVRGLAIENDKVMGIVDHEMISSKIK